MEITKEQLVKAFQIWNETYLKDEEKFTEVNNTTEYAEEQAEHLISLIEKQN